MNVRTTRRGYLHLAEDVQAVCGGSYTDRFEVLSRERGKVRV